MSNNEARIITDQDWEWWCGLPDSLKYILMMNTPYMSDLLKLGDEGKIEINCDLYNRTGTISKFIAYCVGSPHKGRFGKGLEDIEWKEGVSTEDINQLTYLPSLKSFTAWDCGLTEICANKIFEDIHIGEGNHIQDFADPTEFVKLKELYIKNNPLSSDQCWENLGKIPNLEKLTLEGTNIKINRPAEFFKLKGLYIWDNPLSEQSWEILGSIPHLETLELINTNISVASSAKFVNLKELCIKSNKLSDQCWGFLEKIPHLERLYLESNGIIKIPMLGLTKLKKLRLISGESEIIGLENLASLSNLTALGLATKCMELPDLSELISLKYWGLSGGLTAKSFENVKFPPNLEVLELNFNNFDLLPDLSCLTSLKVLEMHNNKFTTKSFENVKFPSNLKMLDLRHNDIELLSNLSALTELEVLDMEHNKLTAKSFENVKFPPNLKRLELFGNKELDEIPNAISQLTKLVSLHLGDTQITAKELPKLASLRYLEELHLSEKTIDRNDAEVVKLKAQMPNLDICFCL